MWITRRYEEDIQRACMETEEKIQLNLRMTSMETRIATLEHRIAGMTAPSAEAGKSEEEPAEQRRIGF